jgi:hypothetical protein
MKTAIDMRLTWVQFSLAIEMIAEANESISPAGTARMSSGA